MNVGKDIETKSKAFFVIIIMIFSLLEYIFSNILYDYLMTYDPIGKKNNGLFVLGLCLEWVPSFVLHAIFYGILFIKMEGYYKHNGLKTFHYCMYVFISLLPHGDFLLHLGYKQIGFSIKGEEESFPVDFELPR